MSGKDPVPNAQAYEGVRAASPPTVVKSTRAPTSADLKYAIGTIWINTAAGSSYFLTQASGGSATWNLNGAGATGAILSITGDSGGAEVPTGGGNFNILGTANQVTVTGSANTETLSVPSTFIAPGTIQSTSGFTLNTGGNNSSIANDAAAVTLTIGNVTGATGIVMQVGTGNFSLDGVGGSTYAIGPSTTTGSITIGGTAETGAITLGSSSGTNTVAIGAGTGTTTVNIANGVSGNTVSIANGVNTSAQTVNIANGASGANSTVNILSGVGTVGAGVLALGNNTRVTTIGLGNIAPAAARTTTIAGGNSAQNDTVNILNGAPSANTQTVSVLSGTATGGTQALNLGNGIGGALTVSIGNGVNTTSQTVNIANGASAAASVVNILSGSGTAGTSQLLMADNQQVATIDLGNVAPAAARTTTIAGGNSAQNDTVNVLNGAPSANTQTFSLLSGTATGGTQVANIANSIGGSLTVNVANGVNSTAQTVNIANGASAANTTLNIMSGVGTAGVGVLAIGNNTRVTTIGLGNIAPAAARTTTINGGNSAQNDTVNILAGAPSAGTQTVNILSGVSTGGTQAVNIASGASASTTTIGNTTGASALNLLGGTNGIVITPTQGAISIVPSTSSTASPTAAVTQNKRLGVATFTGFTTASAGTQAFTINNTTVTATSSVFVTVANLNASTNNAQMSLIGVTQAANSIIVNTKNNGPGALGAGDNVLINFWILS